MKPAAPLLCVLLLAACGPQVVMQSVPVSTDPGGVSVVVDGKPACTAPCRVDLPRNQDHILTLTKDGYRQQDVLIKRQYQTNKVLLNALNEGTRSNSFFKDGWMGVNSGVQSVNRQEETGEAYVLVPSTVSIRLVPVSGFPARATAGHVEQSQAEPLSPLDAMAVGDQQMLENVLETSRSGETTAWSNPETGTSFSVVPERGTETASGEVVRWFTLGARQGGRTASGHYPGHRMGRGEWAVSLPNQDPSMDKATDKGAEEITRRETMRALGQAPWPTANKSWDVGSSGSSHTSSSTRAIPGGSSTSTTTTSTRTSAKAGVSVGPGALFDVLNALGGGDK